MRPRDENVIPFRRKPRKWTRPEDYGTSRLLPPSAPAKRRHADWRRARRALAVWALILALIAGTVAWSVWG